MPDAQSTSRTRVTRHGSFYVERSWDDSTEYCAWIYATPKGEYEISWIATSEIQSKSEFKKCALPRRVFDRRYADDPHYPDRDIIYVLAVHSHPVPTIITLGDIGYITDVDRYINESLHNNGQADLGIVAFFASASHDEAVCGGFFQYTLSTNEIRKWTPSKEGKWHSVTVATVRTRQTTRGLEVQVDMIK